jgi:hypothetical protein
MGFFSSILHGLTSIGATVVGLAYQTVTEFKEKVKATIYKYQTVDSDFSEEVKETRSVNDHISDLEKKRKRDGCLNEYDRQELSNLYNQREILRQEMNEKKEMDLAKKMADNSYYDHLTVTDENLHVIQFHVGQNVLGKTCSCGRPMVLQWQRNRTINKTREFFWGCSGFYSGECRGTQSVTETEYGLMTKIDRPEFEISNQSLNRIVDLPQSRNSIGRRMNDLKNQEVTEYFCPTHNEVMVLKENRNSNGLMDQYFLGCPRYFDVKCEQIVKLKSAAQLAAVLEANTGRGIL